MVRPMREEFFHDDVADGVRGFQGWEIATVGADALLREALGGGHATGLTIKVAYGAQDEHAFGIDAPGLAEEFKRL